MIVLLALGVACWTSFAWAILRFFRREAPRSAAMTANGVAGAVFGALQFGAIWFETDDQPAESTIGLLLSWAAAAGYLSSLGLFWWTVIHSRNRRQAIAFSEGAPSTLYVDGPYGRIRHPFYAAYMLFWLAGLLAAPDWPQLLAVLVMFSFYALAALGEERAILASPLRDQYAAYAQRAGRFTPRISIARSSNGYP
jgi:protein-S-isoprenylcysteine O-methyltransferase Ste14